MPEETRFDEVEVNRETQLVSYNIELNEADKASKMDKIVKLDDDLSRLASEKAVMMAEFNSRGKALEREISMLIQHCRDGFEVKEEDCTFEYRYDLGLVFFYSCETGEKVHEREITNEERQLKLFADKRKAEEADDEEE